MARNLYRFYLYIIFIALVIFTVVVTAQLLGTLLELTPLRGSYTSPPAQTTITQALVFAVIGWLISGALGGLHYWLIRRDQKNDPAAGGSAIRSFFLNMTIAGGVLLVVPIIGFGVLNNWAYTYGSDMAQPIGVAVPTLLMILGLESERRRFPARQGAALVFQRLHFFGVQLILLFFMTSAIIGSFRPIVDILFFGGRGECHESYCTQLQVGGLLGLQLWFIACWLIYSLITAHDLSRLVRMIMHGFSLAFALGWTLFGVFTALKVLLSPLFQLPVSYDAILGTSASNDFISPLVLGLLSTLIYHLLLRDIIQRGLIERTTLLLSEGTIAALLLAGVFWWACGLLLYNLLQTLAPVPAGPDAPAWLMTVALLITGVSYIPLDLVIRRRFDIDPAHAIGPRRSLVLALLAVGILTLAIGGAIALYAWGTALLGSPLTNWQQLAHSGLAATIVGAALVAIYVWPLRGEHLLARPARSAPIPETPAAPGTIEDILDELLAGQITRSEAAVRLRALNGTATLLLI